jgi:hypothetical protein
MELDPKGNNEGWKIKISNNPAVTLQQNHTSSKRWSSNILRRMSFGVELKQRTRELTE